MKLMSPRFLPLWAGAWLVLTLVLSLFRGPFLLERRIELDLAARRAGPDWSLVWLDKRGELKNGLWLALTPEPDGILKARLVSPVTNRSFETLALQWRGMPGMQVDDPSPVTLVERVLWWETRTELPRRDGLFPEVLLKEGVHTSAAADGGLAWSLPVFTVALAQDAAVVWLTLLVSFLVGWTSYHLKDGTPWYTPGRAALTVVVLVHTWLVIRAPLLYCPDSMDYLVNTKLLVENRTFDHFSTWRLPGYSVFLAPLVGGLHRFNLGIGVAQGVLAVLTAWMAGRVTRAFLSAPWAALTVLLVGLDPVLMTYARHAMPECLCTFLVTAAAWASVQSGFWSSHRTGRAVLAAIALGLLLAGMCYVRGNLLIVAALVPLIIASWPALDGSWRRAVILALTCGVTTAACLAPWVARMHRQYGRAEFVIGSGYTRAISLADARALDFNQTAAYSRERWNQLRAAHESGNLIGNRAMNEIGNREGTKLSRQVEGKHSWTARDEAAGFMAAETVARDPLQRWSLSARAVGNLLGLWPLMPWALDNQHWSRELRGWVEPGLNWRTRPEAYGAMKLEHTRDIYDRSVESTATWSRSDQADAFERLWSLAVALRPLWAALVLLGILCAMGRRRWALVLLGGMLLAHALVVAFHLLSGIDRYQVPLYPLMTVLAVYATASLAGAARLPRPTAGAPTGDPARTTRFDR